MTLQGYQLACSRGERHLFTDINFEIVGGDALRIAGTNGSGKTSLLRLLCGLAYPAAGEVRWNGQNVRRVREDFCSELIYLGHANGVKDDLAAWENLMVSATLAGHPINSEQAWRAVDLLGLDEVGHLPTRALSQGQRKRVALARLWLEKTPKLWILDEPFTALDSTAVVVLCRRLERHLAAGGLLVYTTHQEIVLGAGRMLELNLAGEGLC
ncbi:MAG TPA: cytochrome c biogenesis heme-transporting ATPase CcmA [Burkholderiaceae bacterium]|jgi:heme exporter protein A|nr:cytochrome c biogenesis heme-transporting ATPase CcmA [Burkholderiaceae bacterium]